MSVAVSTLEDGRAQLVGAVRAQLREKLAHVPADLAEVAILLADEIVTNAIMHGDGGIGLNVVLMADRIRVEVTDASVKSPLVLAPSSERENGRGMAIVDHLASAWGTERRRRGKLVWFELSYER